MAYPPASLATTRTDATATATTHPADHNNVNAAVNDIVAELGTNPSGNASTVQTLFEVPASLKRTGALYETLPRLGVPYGSQAVLLTGRLSLIAVGLPTGLTVTNIAFVSGNVAAGTPTNWWFALYNSALALLRQTADQTTTAWATNTEKIVALTSPFVTTYSGLHYLGIMVTATTVPTIQAVNGSSILNGLAPVVSATSTTGLTTTAPNPAGALTGLISEPYAYVS